MGPVQAGALILVAAAGSAAACDYRDDLDSPLRGAVAAVKHLPVTEAWERTLPAGTTPRYILHLDRVTHLEGRCYWTLEVRAGGETWRRFLVTPGGGHAIEESGKGQ